MTVLPILVSFFFGKRMAASARRGRRHGARLAAVKLALDFEPTPWADAVQARPVFAVSDNTGANGRRLTECVWAQFGLNEEARLKIFPEVSSAADVEQVVEEACSANEKDGGVLVIITLASRELNATLASMCSQRGVPFIDALQPLLSELEATLGQPRLGGIDGSAAAPPPAAPAESAEPLQVFTVSDSTTGSICSLARAALRQFPNSGIKALTACPSVRSVEEIRLIAAEAGRVGGLVAFTFASTGMSRFMRQCCQQGGAHYVDVYQPLILAMEIHLDYPAIGVPGGYAEAPKTTRSKWKSVEL